MILNKEVYRHSHERELILKVLESTKVHPTASWVYSRLKQDGHKISRATVYRNLMVLSNLGVIKKLDFTLDNTTRYDGNIESHEHFICKKFGDILDKKINSLKKKIDKYSICSICC